MPPQRHRHFPFGTIVAAVILVAAVVMLFSNGGEDPVNDLKGIAFDSFDTTCTLGEAVSRNTSHTEWKSQKESDGSYVVTVGCVEKMYGMSLKVEFSVTYTDDWVYGQPQAVYFSGDRYTDSTSIAAAMMLLYGQLDEQGLSELMAYDMLWDVFSDKGGEKMFCPNCRRIEEVPERTTCGICGAKLRAGTPEQPEGPDTEFLFTKKKGFSYFYYKEIQTEVSLTDTNIDITQTNTWFAFFKRPAAKVAIPCTELQSVEIYYSWDFWDMLFAALITVISQMSHWTWFLLVLLFLYTAAGRVIAIYYKDGAVWRIPVRALGKHRHRAEEFVQEVRKHIPKGVQ